MKKLILLLACIPMLFSCEKLMFEETVQSDDPYVNFDYMWKECDEKYAFFEYKNIDWDAVKNQYRPMLYNDMSNDSLFNVIAAMLRELRDDHTNLISQFNVSSYGNFKNSQDNFDWRVILDHYLPENYYNTGPFRHGYIRGDSIAYIRFAAFTGSMNDQHLDFMLNEYENTKGLVIDIRENGGGSIRDIFNLLSRFVDERTLVYYSRLKNGPEHNDFGAKEPAFVSPSAQKRYTKKVVMLADRGSYSASSFTALAVRSIPNIILMGDTTGGGLGIPNGGQLPNGWNYRFSVTQTLDPQGNNYEDGVPPEILAQFNWNDLQKDEILERAIQEINTP